MFKPRKIAQFLLASSIIFFILSFYSFYKVNSLVVNNESVVHNSFIEQYDISNVSINNIDHILEDIEKRILSNEITLIINNKEYKYTISELGITINKDEIKEEIMNYENQFDYWDLYNNYSKNSFDKKIYNYRFIVNEDNIRVFLNQLKKRFDRKAKNGKLVMQDDRQLKYIGEVVGYSINVDKNLEIIKNNFNTIDYNNSLDIIIDSIFPTDEMKKIDTKISSFTTTFDDTIDRKYNLMAGAKKLDGKIIYPQEIFSFYENVGPYTGINEFVYYSGMMGNGVCQVATTLYNAELLAGLSTVERYNHGKKSVYVDGGLDATVAVTSGIVTDFKFKNGYDTPVYISAFVEGSNLTIELWSNENVKNGLEYKTESVRLGYGTYKAYRHAYKDGNLVNSEDLGYSYYFAE